MATSSGSRSTILSRAHLGADPSSSVATAVALEYEGEFDGEAAIEQVGEEIVEDIFGPDIELLASLLELRLLHYVHWTESESGWRRTKTEGLELETENVVSKVIAEKFSESFAGQMLYSLNFRQPNSYYLKFTKINLMKYDLQQNEFPHSYERLNYYLDDIVGVLDKCVRTFADGYITIERILLQTPILRLTNCQISSLDNSLVSFDNIRALILASNYLHDFPGSLLPRNLKLLELYGNTLETVCALCTDAPIIIMYLGIGRNYLSDESGMINLINFEHLFHLDLSDNDFCDADSLLEILSRLPNLESLEMIGNPCSLSISYRRKFQDSLPNLLYLDGEPVEKLPQFLQLLKKDQTYNNDACLQVYGIRMMSIPTSGVAEPADKDSKKKSQKKKKKSSNASYRLELELPLLDDNLRDYELKRLLSGEVIEESKEDFTEQIIQSVGVPVEEPKNNQEQKSEHDVDEGKHKKIKEETENKNEENKKVKQHKDENKKGKPQKNKQKKAGKDKGKPETKEPSETSGKSKKKSEKNHDIEEINERYNRYLARDKPYPVQTTFVSKEVTWNKIVGFQNPCIQVPVPAEMLARLRDTMRSVVTLRLVQMAAVSKKDKKSAKSEKKKKNKKSKSEAGKGKKGKGAKSGKKDKSGKGNQSDATNGALSSAPPGTDKKEKVEEAPKNNTIAKIRVPLQMVNWSENYVGYIWDIKWYCLARPFPDIESIEYKSAKGAKDAKGKSKAEKGKKKGKDKKKQSEKGKGKQKSGDVKAEGKEKKKAGPREIPPYLTCHFGIGLKRDPKDDLKALFPHVGNATAMKTRLARLQAARLKKRITPSQKQQKKRQRMEETLLTIVENINKHSEIFRAVRSEYGSGVDKSE